MPLLPDPIRLLDEAAQFFIQIIRFLDSEVVDMIAPRDGVDAYEARSFVPVRQNQMTNYLGALDLERGKRHANLKCNPGLLGQDGHRPALPGLSDEHFVKLAKRCRFASKV